MDDNPLNNVFLRNAKPLTYVALEIFHNTSLHFIETLKVRAMARNLKSGDVSMYFANKVENKRKCHLIMFSSNIRRRQRILRRRIGRLNFHDKLRVLDPTNLRQIACRFPKGGRLAHKEHRDIYSFGRFGHFRPFTLRDSQAAGADVKL